MKSVHRVNPFSKYPEYVIPSPHPSLLFYYIILYLHNIEPKNSRKFYKYKTRSATRFPHRKKYKSTSKKIKFNPKIK